MTPEQFIVFTASPGESLFQEEGVGGATLEATQGATTDNQPQPEPSQYHKTQTTTLVLMLETEEEPLIGGSENLREEGSEQPSSNKEEETTVDKGEGQGSDEFFDFERASRSSDRGE
ncbi:hypothetical protein DEO72_LG9g1066 [Vigna unguiculata]|uniref:Uncharacterized protein n=1 Tax=Vigna unguiculata TaxID=3917 RepID=A0A4D6N224_VIGUN|nr:hypothetical protein DEO72_LG9g1066 [Vigna unguiculata]